MKKARKAEQSGTPTPKRTAKSGAAAGRAAGVSARAKPSRKSAARARQAQLSLVPDDMVVAPEAPAPAAPKGKAEPAETTRGGKGPRASKAEKAPKVEKLPKVEKAPRAPREPEPPKRRTAAELATKQREISVSEFFTKNRHLLGFDNPAKALLTTVKEAVDNSFDACEEAGILPEITIWIFEL